MPIETTYTLARANLAKLLEEVAENREAVYLIVRDRIVFLQARYHY